MADDQKPLPAEPDQDPPSHGFLVYKCKKGEGVIIEDVEVYISKIVGSHVSLAIRAPLRKKIQIKK